MGIATDRVVALTDGVSSRTAAVAAPFAIVLGLAVVLLSPVGKPWSYVEFVAGVGVSWLILARQDRVRETVGVSLYLIALMFLFVPFWSFSIGTFDGLNLLIGVLGIAAIGVASIIAALITAALGDLVMHYS